MKLKLQVVSAFALVLTLGFSSIADCGKPTKPGPTPADPAIAYTQLTRSPKGEQYDLCVMNADGTHRTLLLEGHNNYPDSWLHFGRPAISPTGDRVAVVVESSDNACGMSEIWVMNIVLVEGVPTVGQPTFVIDCNYLRESLGEELRATDPAFSPDGSKLAFRTDKQVCYVDLIAPPHQNLTVAYDGTREVPPPDKTFTPWYPTWSPDGQKIAFQRRESGMCPCGIFTVQLAVYPQLVEEIVTPGIYQIGTVDWSRNSPFLAFMGAQPGDMYIFLVDTEHPEEGQSQLEGTPPGLLDISWTPDDLRIDMCGRNARDRNWSIMELQLLPPKITILASPGGERNFIDLDRRRCDGLATDPDYCP